MTWQHLQNSKSCSQAQQLLQWWMCIYLIAVGELAPAVWVGLLEQCAVVAHGEDVQVDRYCSCIFYQI